MHLYLLCLSSRRSLYGLYPYKSNMIGMESLGDPSGNWDIVETIGKGTYGKVYRVINKKDGSQAAVKVLDPINVSQHVCRESFRRTQHHGGYCTSSVFSCLSVIRAISVPAGWFMCRNISSLSTVVMTRKKPLSTLQAVCSNCTAGRLTGMLMHWNK